MKRVLVAPLDWGLGHATRCVPVIRQLLQRSCTVMIAGSGDSLALLKAEFPALPSFTLPGYKPSYPTDGGMVLSMARQLHKFHTVIRDEHFVIETLVRQHKIDLVISDNRYGCWSSQVPAVFVTHQSNILMPRRFGWLAPVVRRLNERMMKRFSVCWIPDYAGSQGFAGDLASFAGLDPAIRRRHVGPLSRFGARVQRPRRYDLLCIFSGPEPQRSALEQRVVKQLEEFSGRACVVRGLPNAPGGTLETPATVVNFMDSRALQHAIESSAVVLARSGFSTVMDMARLGGKAIFVPTPGQTEQLYLATRLREQGIAFSMPQKEFDLESALRESERYSGFTPSPASDELLNEAITEILAI